MEPAVPVAKLRPPGATGIVRERLLARLQRPGLALVTGPAGAGKTTALAHVSQQWNGPTAWLSMDENDRDPDRLFATMTAALGSPGGSNIGDVMEAMQSFTGGLVVLDDVHELGDSPAASSVTELCRFRPPDTTLVLGARHLSGLPGAVWATLPETTIVRSTDLRFRLWEVDEMLRVSHGTRLSPEQAHSLTRATDGWAVAVHLFGLTARHATPEQRGILIENLADGASVRDYLLQQVLSQLSESETSFLREVSVFDVLDPAGCDRYLDRSGSVMELRALEGRGILQQTVDATFTMHRLIRGHLRRDIVERHGRQDLEDRYHRCGDVLESLGQRSEARKAWARAGAWDRLSPIGAFSIDHPQIADWVADIPEASLLRDPWILQGRAVRMLADGDTAGARRQLADARELLRDEDDDRQVSRQLRLLDDWLHPPVGPPVTWPMRMHRILDGREAADARTPTPGTALADAVGLLVAGYIDLAIERFKRVAEQDEGALRLMALLGVGFGYGLSGDTIRCARAAEQAYEEAELAGWPALARVAYALHSIYDRPDALDGLASLAARSGDHLGAGVMRLLFGLAAPGLDRRAAVLDQAAHDFAGGPWRALQLVASCAATIAGGPDAGSIMADREIRRLGPLPLGLWQQANKAGGDQTHARSQPAIPEHLYATLVDGLSDVDAPVRIQCFDQFAIERDGVAVPIDELRPKHLELLRLLACHCGAWLHRGRLMAWLWPDYGEDKAKASLQTAISAIRGLLDEAGGPSLIERNGPQYRLAVPVRASDLGRIEERLLAATAATTPAASLVELEAAADLARGELVPGSGPSDWAVDMRRAFRRRMSGTANRVLCAVPDHLMSERLDLLAKLTDNRDADDPIWEVASAVARRVGYTQLADDFAGQNREWLKTSA